MKVLSRWYKAACGLLRRLCHGGLRLGMRFLLGRAEVFHHPSRLVASRRGIRWRVEWSRAMARLRAAGHPRADDMRFAKQEGLRRRFVYWREAQNDSCPALAGATQGRRSTALVRE